MVRHVITVFVLLLLSTTAFAQEVPVDNALVACKEQVQKLAADAVAARLEAIQKTLEYKKYEEAVKVQQSLKPVAPKP